MENRGIHVAFTLSSSRKDARGGSASPPRQRAKAAFTQQGSVYWHPNFMAMKTRGFERNCGHSAPNRSKSMHRQDAMLLLPDPHRALGTDNSARLKQFFSAGAKRKTRAQKSDSSHIRQEVPTKIPLGVRFHRRAIFTCQFRPLALVYSAERQVSSFLGNSTSHR